MQNPVLTLEGALEAAQGLSKAVSRARVPIDLEFLSLRASQINGCSWCVDMHAKALRKAGESEERVYGIGAWRELPYYSDAERAALALTEAVTRMADRADPVPDAIYDAAAEHFDEQQLAAIILAIATINLWNRVNVTTRQVVSAA
jgi:AhpD family alkylhydroperoxidase